ncbi:MAG TPA: hypothetical protein VMX79_06850 [bacterium]|nr:hypothetical protein [bacterium]
MSAKRATVGFVVLFFVAVAALVGYRVLNVWLPRRVGEAITERFGEYVTIGEVRYVFPLGVEVRDVVFVKRPRSFVSGEASRVRVKLRPLAFILLRFDARVLKEITTEDYTIYLYPLKVPRPRLMKPWDKVAAGTGEAAAVAGAVLPSPAAPAAGAPPAPAVASGAGGEKPRKAKLVPFDFSFAARRGRVVFRGGAGDTIILRDVDVGGRISDEEVEASLKGKTARQRSFEFSANHSFVTKEGSAKYRVEGVEAVHILPWVGKPGYLLEAEGVLTFEGTLTWRGGKLDHRATGRLSHGRLVLAPDNVEVRLEDVNFQFTLHNADFTVDEGSCRAAEARWHFGGRASKLAVEVTFRSENMTLQNLVDMFVGEVRVSYAGVGVAELRIFGTPTRPEFYIHVERTDR